MDALVGPGDYGKKHWRRYHHYELCWVKKLTLESYLTVDGLWAFMSNDNE